LNFASTPIIEDDLHSFVDNEVDDDRHEAILAHLAATPSDAARTEAWRQQNILLRAAFSQVTLEQVPASLAFTFTPRLIPIPCFGSGTVQEPYSRRVRRRSLAFSLAAFVAGVSITLAAGFSMSHYRAFVADEFAAGPSPQGSALALLASSALHRSPASNAIPQSVLNTPGDITPALVILPVLKRQGLQLIRGEVRGKPEDRANCLDFADASGTPVVLCIAAASVASEPALQGLAVVASHSVYWREAASYYALAAPFANDRLVTLARRIHAVLAARRKL